LSTPTARDVTQAFDRTTPTSGTCLTAHAGCLSRVPGRPARTVLRGPRRSNAPGLPDTNTQVGQIAWLDARHRSHVHVENDVKQAKDLGLDRWPSRFWAINVAWTQIVALAANLLACYRHLALPEGDLRDAAPKLLRYRLWHLPARLTRGQRKRWLHLREDWPWANDVINTWQAVTALPAPT
jgi:hypothetical protein